MKINRTLIIATVSLVAVTTFAQGYGPRAETYVTASGAWPKSVSGNDLSRSTSKQIESTAQYDAMAFHHIHPGLVSIDTMDFGDKFGLDHKLRGDVEDLYAVTFTQTYQTLERTHTDLVATPDPTPTPQVIANNDLSASTEEEITVAAQNDAIAFHNAHPGLGYATNFGEKFALGHNLRGNQEKDYKIEFEEAYQALEQ
jgi:hypothetical protein